MNAEVYEFVRRTDNKFPLRVRNEVIQFVLDRSSDCITNAVDYLSLKRILFIDRSAAVEFQLLFGDHFSSHNHESNINIEVWQLLLENNQEE